LKFSSREGPRISLFLSRSFVSGYENRAVLLICCVFSGAVDTVDLGSSSFVAVVTD